jgi:hypothetical protein
MSGAIGSIFKDGVFVWSTDMVQAFGRLTLTESGQPASFENVLLS